MNQYRVYNTKTNQICDWFSTYFEAEKRVIELEKITKVEHEIRIL